MDTLTLIIVYGIGMCLIPLLGLFILLLNESLLEKVLLSLVGLSAGALLGGALFHMLPAAHAKMSNVMCIYQWTVAGFLVFLVLEQFLNWHHCHRAPKKHSAPIGWLVLIADGVHNFIGGLFVGASFVADTNLGITAWVVAAFHEVPQELGDFGVLLYSGWSKKAAICANILSALPFLVGGVMAYYLSQDIDVFFLIPFTAGSFLYIAAVDLLPQVNQSKSPNRWVHWLAFFLGLGSLFYLA